jgi:hypothetical protein
VTDRPVAGTVWRAALEQLPPDPRGFRRTLRLHAVAFQDSRAAPQALCGYRHQPGELRPERDWETVTASGRCTLCEMQLRRSVDAGISLPDAVDVADASGARRRLTVVADDRQKPPDTERRSPDRP